MTVVLLPGVGLLTWREFETNMGWTNFFVIASSLSLANALIVSGAAAWFADTLVGSVEGLREHPTLILLAMSGAAALVRVVMPNISGYLSFIIPVYDPASATASVFIYQRAEIKASDVVKMGIAMTGIAIGVLFIVVLPYWSLVGESLTP